ncbi:MAG: hypothetical protein ABR613_13280 [Actinomycetota bacterium]
MDGAEMFRVLGRRDEALSLLVKARAAAVQKGNAAFQGRIDSMVDASRYG